MRASPSTRVRTKQTRARSDVYQHRRNGLTDNAAAITFPTPSANWGTVVAFGIFDATSSGNLLVWGPITPNKTINNGDAAPSFAIGALDVDAD